ncbi:outer membrane protein [Kaarinaea lacus]
MICRRFNPAIVVALTILLVSTNLQAAGLTFGAKGGPMQLDASDADDPINAGVAIGYEFGVALGDLGFEGEFTTTVKDGKIGGKELNIDTVGAYVTYRSPGFIYLKARAGYVGWDAAQTLGDSADDTSTSLGLGLGFSLKIIKFELEYTQIDDDIDFISLGILF